MTIQTSQVFISYQRTDGDIARQVRAHLAAAGIPTWMDEYDIPGRRLTRARARRHTTCSTCIGGSHSHARVGSTVNRL